VTDGTSTSSALSQGVTRANQTVSFTSTAPGSATVDGATYTPTATATSGLPVVFAIDSSASSVCSISGGVVSFKAAGTCVVDANQAGNANWIAAAQVQQGFTVKVLLSVTGVVPSSVGRGVSNFAISVVGTGFVSGAKSPSPVAESRSTRRHSTVRRA